MVEHIKFTPEMSNNWSRSWAETEKQRPWAFNRLLDASTTSQLQSKLWIVNELINLNIKPNRVALLGGWFAHLITPLLVDELNAKSIINYEIDEDAKMISYKLNRRYKNTIYKANKKNIMINEIENDFDLVINSSCEHMFPMKKFRQLNSHLKSMYVLQSTNETKYDDHINCVNSPEELANQAVLENVLYSGSKILDNGMTRFMVIGK
jgi:hypothetical protein